MSQQWDKKKEATQWNFRIRMVRTIHGIAPGDDSCPPTILWRLICNRGDWPQIPATKSEKNQIHLPWQHALIFRRCLAFHVHSVMTVKYRATIKALLLNFWFVQSILDTHVWTQKTISGCIAFRQKDIHLIATFIL